MHAILDPEWDFKEYDRRGVRERCVITENIQSIHRTYIPRSKTTKLLNWEENPNSFQYAYGTILAAASVRVYS